tara:strand:+ start:1214 stop:1981 length:768 start_codon:yes stop_codon:yes gene_type:complete
MFLLLALLATAATAAQLPLGKVDCSGTTSLIEGHLHMTSIRQASQRQDCTFPIFKKATYIEFERYSGRSNDKDAWTNITFIGTPNVTVAINNNEISILNNTFNMQTYSKLEKSMWIYASFQKQYIEIHASPVGARHFGRLDTLPHVPTYKATLSASTSTGMEQVLKTVASEVPEPDTDIAMKTIHELERRIDDIELDLDDNMLSTERSLEKINKRFESIETKMKTSYLWPIVCFIVVVAVVVWMKKHPKRDFRLD